MKNRLLLAACLCAASLALHDVSIGHGGTYRGPGDTVPPGGGGGSGGAGPGTSGPVGPSTPGGASTPGQGGGAAGPFVGPGSSGGTVTGGGGVDTTDLSVWQFWWGFNKDGYLNLRDAIYAVRTKTGEDDWFIGRGEQDLGDNRLRPSPETIRDKIVPALLRALEDEDQNDIVTGCLIALAKIGDAKDEQGRSAFQEVIKAYLKDGVQEVSETAALALGILGDEASIELLSGLMLDTPQGQRDMDRTSVPYRTRAFAAYGLGLIGHRTGDEAARRAIVADLIRALELPDQATRDLKVAALIAIGLVPLEAARTPDLPDAADRVPEDWATTRGTQLAYLLRWFRDQDQHYLIRAHVPRALAVLLEGYEDDEVRPAVVRELLAAIGTHTKERDAVVQSAILALGQLGDCDADELDVDIREAVVRRLGESGDQQSKHFAAIALGQIGGRPGTNDPDKGYDAVRTKLNRTLATTGRGNSRLKPWVGLALGVLQEARTRATGDLADRDIALVLRTALIDCRSPADVGAYCIGVGIAKDVDAEAAVLEKLERMSDDEARGYAAVALGLMGATGAKERIQAIVRESKYRPELLRHAAIALGLLGDRELVDDLVDMLANARSLSTQAAISTALGFIGDTRSVDPLVDMLQDESITATARGFAAVALGIVADKERLPWNAKIAKDINYRANTTTLTGEGGTGVLDVR